LLQQTLRCETALDGGSQLAHAKRLSVLPLGERLGHLAKGFDEVRDAERLAQAVQGRYYHDGRPGSSGSKDHRAQKHCVIHARVHQINENFRATAAFAGRCTR
jgi:hypothetical protein